MSRIRRGREDAVDMRRVATLAIANWRWIAASTLAAAGAAFGLGVLTADSFQATALVGVCRPGVAPCGEGLVQLALSDGILRALTERGSFETVPPGSVPVDRLADHLTAYVADPFLVLTAQTSNPEETAAVVNLWAHILVEAVVSDYRAEQESTVASDALAAKSRERWRALETEWLTSQASIELQELRAREESLIRARDRYVEARTLLDGALEKAQDIRERLNARSPDERADRDLEAGVDVLAGRVLVHGFSQACDLTGPDQGEVQPGTAGISFEGGRSVEDLIGVLDCIETIALYDRELVAQAEGQTMAELRLLWQDRARLEVEEAQIQLGIEAARDSVLFAESSALERELAFLEDREVAKIVSQASVPTRPVRPRPTRDVPLAGAVGFFLGLVWIFVRDWWKAGAT